MPYCCDKQISLTHALSPLSPAFSPFPPFSVCPFLFLFIGESSGLCFNIIEMCRSELKGHFFCEAIVDGVWGTLKLKRIRRMQIAVPAHFNGQWPVKFEQNDLCLGRAC